MESTATLWSRQEAIPSDSADLRPAPPPHTPRRRIFLFSKRPLGAVGVENLGGSGAALRRDLDVARVGFDVEGGGSNVNESENRSKNAAHYGAAAERYAREKYGLDVEHDGLHDARGPDGRPWDVKAAMLSRARPRFRLWEDQHRFLAREDGGYVFVAYIPRGQGIEVKRSRPIPARAVRLTFYGAGGHRGTNQVKVPVGRVFSI